MANQLANPGFESAIGSYTGAPPIPTSTGNWTAFRATTTRQGAVFSQGAFAAKVDAPSGTPVATFVYQDLAATAIGISYRLGFDIYIDNDGVPHTVAVFYDYDRSASAAGAPTLIEFTTAQTSLSVNGTATLFDGLTADEWHSVLIETNVGATVQDLTVDGVFQGSATGTTGITADVVTVIAGQVDGSVGATSLFYFDNFFLERTVGLGGAPAGPPLIAVEFAAVKT